MKKLFTLLILILILITPVLAKEVSLANGESHNYKERIIKLITVGSSGSAYITVNEISKVVTKESPVKILNLKISILESDYNSQHVKLKIESTAECLVDDDCDDNKPCTEDTCDMFNTCRYKRVRGCPLENECKSDSSLAEVSGILSYCADTVWLPRKKHREPCANNHECLSNLCNKTCRLGIGGQKMAPAWTLIIFAVLIGIKGALFLITPKYSKIISRNLLKLIPNKTYRIIGIIMVVVAALLIILAVI